MNCYSRGNANFFAELNDHQTSAAVLGDEVMEEDNEYIDVEDVGFSRARVQIKMYLMLLTTVIFYRKLVYCCQYTLI